MKEFYIEFKTWKEGSFEIPWKFWRITDIKDYRLRTNLKIAANDTTVRHVFLSFNELTIKDFLSQYVAADVLAIVCNAETLQSAIKDIESYFDDVEIIGYLELDDNTRKLVKEKWGNQ